MFKLTTNNPSVKTIIDTAKGLMTRYDRVKREGKTYVISKDQNQTSRAVDQLVGQLGNRTIDGHVVSGTRSTSNTRTSDGKTMVIIREDWHDESLNFNLETSFMDSSGKVLTSVSCKSVKSIPQSLDLFEVPQDILIHQNGKGR